MANDQAFYPAALADNLEEVGLRHGLSVDIVRKLRPAPPLSFTQCKD